MTGFTVTADVTDTFSVSTALRVLVATGVAESGGASAAAQDFASASIGLTPLASGSLIVFCECNVSSVVAYTPEAGNTFLDNVAGGAGVIAFGDGWYSGAVTAGTPVVVGASAPVEAFQTIAAYELTPSGTPALDGSTPPLVQSASGVQTTAAFSPPTHSVLAALVMADADDAGSSVTITDTSGLGMTWTQRAAWQSAYEGTVFLLTATVPPVVANDPGCLLGTGVI